MIATDVLIGFDMFCSDSGGLQCERAPKLAIRSCNLGWWVTCLLRADSQELLRLAMAFDHNFNIANICHVWWILWISLDMICMDLQFLLSVFGFPLCFWLSAWEMFSACPHNLYRSKCSVQAKSWGCWQMPRWWRMPMCWNCFGQWDHTMKMDLWKPDMTWSAAWKRGWHRLKLQS